MIDWGKVIQFAGDVGVFAFALWLIWQIIQSAFKFLERQINNTERLTAALEAQSKAVNELLVLERQRDHEDLELRKEVERCHDMLCELVKKRRGK